MKSFLPENNREKMKVSERLHSRLGRRELLAIAIICVLAVSAIYSQMYMRYPPPERRNIVGLIRVEGYIEDPLIVRRYSDVINQAFSNDSVRAVVLVVDSGGGYADYVEHVYLDLLQLKTVNKPLVASVIAALSGGYYIAVAADHIYTLPSSFIGSIGVIGRGPPVLIPSESVLETGAYKATGFSKLLFPYNLCQALDNFASAVETRRGNRLKLSSSELRKAMIYLGTEAVGAGLADDIGSVQKAIEKAARMAGLVEYRAVELRPRDGGSYETALSSTNYTAVRLGNVTLQILDELHPPPALHYIYLPSQVITQSQPLSISPATPAAGNGKVLVDASHGNQISWWGLDILIAELAQRNVTTSFISTWRDLDSKLTNASCLIVASPTKVYADDECESIVKFVDKGGLLLLFFDPAWEYIGNEGLSQGIIAPVNSLATRFGLSFAKGYLYNEAENFGIYRNIYVRNFTSSVLTQNLSSLVLFTTTHIYSRGKGVAYTSNNTYSSVAEKADCYATMVLTKKEEGAVVAFGDLSFLSEPYCHAGDNHRLILNLASLITEMKPSDEGEKAAVEERITKPDMPVGTEKNFTEWVDGEKQLVRWVRVSETEIKIERPDRTTHYFLNRDGALSKWTSDGMECTYEQPIPEAPYPLTKGKRWNCQSNYTLIWDGEKNAGKFAGEDWVEGFEDLVPGDGEKYFCAKVEYKEVEHLLIDGRNMTMMTTGRCWISSEAGTVREEYATDYYLDGVFAERKASTLLLESIQKE